MEKKEYIRNFEKRGFGLFVHFGLYSVLGQGEWAEKLCGISKDKYEQLLSQFRVSQNWAKELVNVAKKAGCKYITLTTRHHDGFSLYDTKNLSSFDVMHTPCKRDLIKEFVDECNKENILPIFYHTLIDWHNEDYSNNFEKYIDYLSDSIEILCKNYGKVGGFWFDGMWDKPNENWQEDRIYGIIRKYQKDAIIVNNTGLSQLGKVGHKEIDSVTFERGKPCFVNNLDKYRAGEMCQVLNDHWGYTKNDCNYKSIKEIIENLVDCRSNNCNFLLNTGLRGDGSFTPIEENILLEIGKWIKANKDIIYNLHSADLVVDNGIPFTDGKNYYIAIKDVNMSADPNVALHGKVKYVYLDKNNNDFSKVVWVDSGEETPIKNGRFIAKPFSYGKSLSIRIAQLEK